MKLSLPAKRKSSGHWFGLFCRFALKRAGGFALATALSHVAFAQPQPDCLQAAAERYQVPVELVRAILKAEGGRPGLAVRNKNGSFDLGPMQINTIWLPSLHPLGITLAQLRDDYCVNVAVGTWILARELQRMPREPSRADVWQAAANYHSRTPLHNLRYATLLWQQLKAQPESTKP
jgi:soluble lytic murein transglycosylase-like protein